MLAKFGLEEFVVTGWLVFGGALLMVWTVVVSGDRSFVVMIVVLLIIGLGEVGFGLSFCGEGGGLNLIPRVLACSGVSERVPSSDFKRVTMVGAAGVGATELLGIALTTLARVGLGRRLVLGATMGAEIVLMAGTADI